MPQLMKMPTKNIRYIAVDIDNIMTNAHKTPQEAKDSMQEVYQSVSNYQGKNKIVEVRIIEVNLAFEPDETIYDDIYGDSLYMHPETIQHANHNRLSAIDT